MATHYIYWKFSEHSEGGVFYSVFSQREHESANEGGYSNYTFICQADIPEINMHDVMAKGVETITKTQGELQGEINKLEEKKQQLLALEYKGVGYE